MQLLTWTGGCYLQGTGIVQLAVVVYNASLQSVVEHPILAALVKVTDKHEC